MRRRDFLTFSAAAATLAAPLRALAQQANRVPKVAYLSAPQPAEWVAAFRSGLAKAGYADGATVAVEFFTAPTNADLPKYAADAVAAKPDVIFAEGSPAATAAKSSAGDIPVVFYTNGDPVGLGLIESIAKPNVRLTGIMGSNAEQLAGKQLGLLRDIKPGLSRIAFFGMSSTPVDAASLAATIAAAKDIGAELTDIDVEESPRFQQYFVAAREANAEAIVFGSYAYFSGPNDGKELMQLQAEHGLPLTADQQYLMANGVTNYVVLCYLAQVYGFPTVGVAVPGLAGILVGYGPNTTEIIRQSATDYVAPILRGADARQMAIELPTIFDLAVNLKTAKVLGLRIPQSVLLQATEVIE